MIPANHQLRFVRELWALATAVGFALAGGCGSDTDTAKAPAPTADEARQQKIDSMKGGVNPKGATKPEAGK